ncbi:ras-related protein Rab-39A [Heteronotia binoei]|uniref:ras-related protein Rab-39A n=1 Tax=Heteronotia binoei TaxID=13085 RepID=UPI00292DC56A|nr:ras-related protein Rab-39A [Heteronotia binoei]
MPGIGAVGARCRHRPRRRPNKAEASGSHAAGEGALEAAIWLYQFRLIVLGDSTVGKSCLLHRFAEGRFPGPVKSDPTVGVDFYSRLVEIEPGKRVKLLLWDTAGQERFRSITRSYYRHSVGGLLVFDITNRSSFDHVCDWLEEAKMHADPFQLVFILVGHKCDLESQRQVSREEAEELASACGMKYIETSAKDATNVEESFTILTTDIYELVKKGEITVQDGWEGVKSDYIPDAGHSLEQADSPGEQCPC